MEVITQAAISFAVTFVLCIPVFYLLLRKKTKPEPRHTVDAAQLLHDLTAHGSAVVRVEVIDPSHFYLRRPKG